MSADAKDKEKPPLYTFVASWTLPRAQWADMVQAAAAAAKVGDQALAAGTITTFGSDTRLVHLPDTDTHDVWWSAHSLAGVLNALDEMFKSGVAMSPTLAAATAHSDVIFVSHHYNWKPGTLKNAYTHGAFYQFKNDAANDSLDVIAQSFIEPMFDKLVADGTLQGYEIDEEAIHTQNPDGFWLFYISPTAAGQGERSARRRCIKANPLVGPAFNRMADSSLHRDSLFRTT
ncbi:MAG: hypothetical protein U1F11_14105 [Steroidobacteraceae bacterium]